MSPNACTESSFWLKNEPICNSAQNEHCWGVFCSMEATFDPIFVLTWVNYEHKTRDILKIILFVQLTTDYRFRIGSSKLPEFAKSHPIGLVMLCTLLIYPSKQYSITWSVKTCLRTYLLSVLWGWKKTSLAILLSPNVTSAELLWVNLGNNGIYFCIYLGKLGESAT